MKKNKKNHLWAPWRREYVVSGDKERECVFCLAAGEKDDKKSKIIYRGKESFALLNIYPYNCGHVMVAPYRHIADFCSLTESESGEVNSIMQKILEKMKETMSPHGFNIGMNLGRTAGAGIENHLHVHVVPRWEGDTNFMPVVAEEKVMPESLGSVWRKLKIEY